MSTNKINITLLAMIIGGAVGLSACGGKTGGAESKTSDTGVK